MRTTLLHGSRGRHRAWRMYPIIGAMVGTLLPLGAALAHEGETTHEAPELAGVVVGDNLPVAPVAPLTTLNAPGRVAGGIGVNPDDPDHLVAFTWNMHAEPGETCEYHVSRDGGRTWNSGIFATPEGFNTEGEGNRGYCSNERGGNRHSTHGEMEFGANGVVYVAFVGVKEGVLGNSLLVAKSMDGGDTWSVPTEAIEGGTSEFFDAPGLLFARVAVDPGGGVGGADRIYVQGRGDVVAADGSVVEDNIAVAVSDDGGGTWSEPVAVNRVNQGPEDDPADFIGTLGSQIVIGPDGTAYTAWRDRGRPDGVISIGRTADAGQSWTVNEVVPVRAYTTNGDPEPSPQATSGYPRLAVDDTSGALYLVYHQDRPLPAEQDGTVTSFDHWFDPHAVVLIVKSTDGGATWSDPIQVNDEVPADDGNAYRQIRIPNVAVSPTGRVDVVWMDRRHWTEGRGSVEDGSQERPSWRFDDVCIDSHAACTEARISDIYYSFSTDGGQSFSTDLRVTDYSSNNEVGWEWNIGPFWHHGMDLDHAGDDVVAAWGDSRRGQALPHVTWIATSNEAQCPPDCRVSPGAGGPENQDLYIARISHGNDPDAPPPVQAIPADSPGNLAAAMSAIGYPGGRQARLTGNRITSPFSRAVLVNEDDWASALVGSVLARRYMGPLLTTPAGALPMSVSKDLDRMNLVQHEQADPANPDTENNDQLVHRALGGAIILGDTGAVGTAVEADVRGRDVEVVRFGGDHVTMAAAVARDLDDRFDREVEASVPAFDAVVIVNPGDPDSAVVSALAANRRLPVLFVDTDAIPPATQAALDDLHIDRTLIVGDTAAVSDVVASQLPGAERLSGSDVFALSKAVVQESHERGLPQNVVYVVGDDPMHAALVGSSAARAGGLLVAAPGAGAAAALRTVASLGLDNHVQRVVRTVAGVGCADQEVPDSSFSDRADIAATHRVNVDCAAWRGIVRGLTDGSYAPVEPVSRAGMASFIARALEAAGVDLPAASSQRFTDVAAGSTHDEAIHRLAAAGIVRGGAGGAAATSYVPEALVRRDQMASFLVRAAEFATGGSLQSQTQAFSDVDANNPHFGSVNGAAELGLASGLTADTYGPDRDVRRDQMATFVIRLFQYLAGSP